MAEVNIDIAKQSTSEEIDNKVGTPEDIGGAEGVGSMHAKENTLLRQTRQILDHLQGEYLNNFGDGRMGNFVYGTSPNTPIKDEYNRKVYYTENFTIPVGKTMKPYSNSGMIVWARGNITIDGTLDLSESRYRYSDPEGLPKSITVAGTGYNLAVGGNYSALSTTARCGDSGVVTLPDGTILATGITDDGSKDYAGIPPSVSGGNSSYYRYIYSPIVMYNSYNNCWSAHSCDSGDIMTSQEGSGGAGAVVLICAGTIKIAGIINAKYDEPFSRSDGGKPSYSTSSGIPDAYHAGVGGKVLIHQGGGGAVTMISKTLDNTGTINVSGNASQTISAGTDNIETLTATLDKKLKVNDTLYDYPEVILTGGKGANSYTVNASSAGNIKQYTLSS